MDDDYAKEWASRASAQPEPSQPRLSPAATPPVAQALPVPPAGFGYVWSQPHGQYVLVALGVAASPPAIAPPGPQVIPHAGAPARPARGAMPRTCQLVRPGDVDPYAKLLSETPEIAPAQAGHFFQGLQPTEDDLQTLATSQEADPSLNYHPPAPADPMGRVAVSDDPAADAFPRGPVARAKIAPLPTQAPGT